MIRRQQLNNPVVAVVADDTAATTKRFGDFKTSDFLQLIKFVRNAPPDLVTHPWVVELCNKFSELATAVVYGLTDPRDNKIRYVGRTINKLSLRLNAHKTGTQYNASTRKDNWLRELSQLGLAPGIVVLEVIDIFDVVSERRWIKRLREQGANLTNANTPSNYLSYAGDRK